MITIETSSFIPIYEQIKKGVKSEISLGVLKANEALPSIRNLAAELVVNPNTVARVYIELEREGLLNTRPGLGVFVAQPRAELTKKVRRERLQKLLDGFLTEAVHLGFSSDEVVGLVAERVKQFRWQSEGS